MKAAEFTYALFKLRLEPKETARLLSVDLKTVRRWLSGQVTVPGPVKQAVTAWILLDRLKLPWRPEGIPIAYLNEDEIAEEICRFREEAINLAAVLERVQERGGPATRWHVDLEQCVAEFPNTMSVFFYPLPNGGFLPTSYSRLDDKSADERRDQALLDDAIASISQVVTAAGPNWINERHK